MKIVKKILIILHFALLTIALLTFCSDWLLNFGFIGEIDVVLRLLVFCTGVLAFFFHLKSKIRIILYLSIYALGAAILLLIIFTNPHAYKELPSPEEFTKSYEFQQDNLRLYREFTGLIGVCCGYEVREVKMKIFEKNYGSFGSRGDINFKKTRIVDQPNEVHIYYFLEIDHDNTPPKEKKVVIKK